MARLSRVTTVADRFSLKSLLIVLVFLLIPIVFLLRLSQSGQTAEAAWYNDSWMYRQQINVASHNVGETNVYLIATISISSTTKAQVTDGDFRFTAANGSLLPYYLSSGVGTTTITFHIFLSSFPAGAQTLYAYYGNSSASNGATAADFATQASNYSVGSYGSEESGGGPVAYWKFDEGVGTSTYDSTANQNNAVFAGGTSPSWTTEDQCIAGKCLQFSGSGSYLNAGNKSSLVMANNSLTVETWVKFNYLDYTGSTGKLLGFAGKGNCDSLSPTNGWWFSYDNRNNGKTFSYTCFGNSAGGYNGGTNNLSSISYTFSTGVWYHLALTVTSTQAKLYINGIQTGNTIALSNMQINDSASNFVVAQNGGGYGHNGYLDDVKIYPYARSSAQVKADYNAGKAHSSSSKGTSAGFGSNSKNSDVLSNSLIGYWKLNDNTGTSAADSSGNGYVATFGTGASAPSWSTGKYGVGLSFNGTSTYLTTGTIPYVAVPGKSGCAWVYPISFPSSLNAVFRKSGSSGMSVRFDSTGHFNDRTVNTAGTNSSAYGSPDAISTGKWSFVCVTWESPGPNQNIKLRYYINGKIDLDVVTDISDPNGSVEKNSNQSLWIGNDPDLPTRVWNGLIDEVRLYNRTLQPSEIASLYYWAPGPVGWWKFDEGAGTTAYDSSGNSINGLLRNSPSWVPGKYGQAISYNGSNQDVSITNDSHIDFNYNQDLTVSAWFKAPTNQTTTPSTDTSLLEKWSGAGGYAYVIRFYNQSAGANAGKVKAARYDGTNNPSFTSSNTYNDNQWHYLSFTKLGSTLSIFVDGISQGTAVDTTTTTTTNSSPLFVASRNGGYPFSGSIDDLKIYSYARTQKQIVEDMNAGHPAGGSPIGSQLVYYKFEEGYGTTVNNSGNLGTTYPLVFGTNSTIPTWTTNGKFGKALYFGTNSLIQGTYYNAALNYNGTGGWSLSAWINPDANESDGGYIISKAWNGNGNYNYYLKYNSDRTITLAIGGTSTFTMGTTTTIPTGSWHYVAGTTDSTTGLSKIYIDGQLAASTSTSAINWTVNNTSRKLVIGCIYDYGNYCSAGTSYAFNGFIDEAKVYSYALTDSEIALDYNRGAATVLGSLSSGAGNTAPPGSAGQEYCLPGDSSTCSAPVARWDFEEGSGTTAYDTSGNTLNAGWTGTGSHWANGKVGKACSFNGTDDYLTAASSSLFDVNDNTVEAWVNPSAYPASETKIVSHGACTKGRLKIMSAGTVTYEVGDTSTCSGVTTDATIPLHAWTQLTAVRTGSTLSVYLNGVLSKSANFAITPVSSNNIYLGATQGATSLFSGLLDNVRIFNYARTPAQIAWDYNRGAPVGWWKFDECQGSVAYDSSGLGNTGNISIGPSGTQNTLGTCQIGTSAAWTAGAQGKINSSLNFDGTDDYVAVSPQPTLSNNQLSISAWINLNSCAPDNNSPWYGYRMIADSTAGALTELHGLGVEGTSNCYANAVVNWDVSIPSGQRAAVSGNPVPLHQWQHLTMTATGTVLKLYQNGQLTGTANLNGTLQSIDTLKIGKFALGSLAGYFDGQLDDVRIYNYALTQNQIQQIYNNGAIRIAPVTGTP